MPIFPILKWTPQFYAPVYFFWIISQSSGQYQQYDDDDDDDNDDDDEGDALWPYGWPTKGV